MILFGTRWLSWGREHTRRPHYCVECGKSSRFQLRTRMRFFYLYLIPLIPVSGKQLVYRCPHCGTTFDRAEG